MAFKDHPAASSPPTEAPMAAGSLVDYEINPRKRGDMEEVVFSYSSSIGVGGCARPLCPGLSAGGSWAAVRCSRSECSQGSPSRACAARQANATAASSFMRRAVVLCARAIPVPIASWLATQDGPFLAQRLSIHLFHVQQLGH